MSLGAGAAQAKIRLIIQRPPAGSILSSLLLCELLLLCLLAVCAESAVLVQQLGLGQGCPSFFLALCRLAFVA